MRPATHMIAKAVVRFIFEPAGGTIPAPRRAFYREADAWADCWGWAPDSGVDVRGVGMQRPMCGGSDGSETKPCPLGGWRAPGPSRSPRRHPPCSFRSRLRWNEHHLACELVGTTPYRTSALNGRSGSWGAEGVRPESRHSAAISKSLDFRTVDSRLPEQALSPCVSARKGRAPPRPHRRAAWGGGIKCFCRATVAGPRLLPGVERRL